MESDDAGAISQLGYYYNVGECGLPQDYDKRHNLWLRAGDLGRARAYYNMVAYMNAEGVEMDMEKAKYYWELAVMGANVEARFNLGNFEEKNAGNMSRAMKHYMIAAGDGYDKSLKRKSEMVI